MFKKFIILTPILILNFVDTTCMHRVTRAAILATRLPKINLFKKSLTNRFPKQNFSQLTKSTKFKQNQIKKLFPYFYQIEFSSDKFEFYYRRWQEFYYKYKNSSELDEKLKGQLEGSLRIFYQEFKECENENLSDSEKNISEILEEFNQVIEKFRNDLQKQRIISKFKWRVFATAILTCLSLEYIYITNTIKNI